jgi:hypothetical protein
MNECLNPIIDIEILDKENYDLFVLTSRYIFVAKITYFLQNAEKTMFSIFPSLFLWFEKLIKIDQQVDSHNKQYISQLFWVPWSFHPLPIINPYLLPCILPKEKHIVIEYHFSYRMQSTPKIHNNTLFILMQRKKNPLSFVPNIWTSCALLSPSNPIAWQTTIKAPTKK